MEGDLDMTGETNWDSLLLELDLPDFDSILENSSNEPETVTKPSQPLSTPTSHEDAVVFSWIGEMDKVLMEDDHFDDRFEIQPASDDFLADILVDSPLSGSASGEVIDDSAATRTIIDNDDPIAKKQRRQLRNRDAAVRSRERKKMYVRDLEMKSRYLEVECRRLVRMLQFFIAENQALRLTLYKGYAFDASSAKQESAVLLLESLLLGSLLWFLGIMCLFTLPILPNSLLELVPPEDEERIGPERVAPSRAGSSLVGHSFVKEMQGIEDKDERLSSC